MGPQDYMNSSWFNWTEDSDGVFVPMSCCVPVTLQSEEIVSRQNSEQRDNYCQVHAILYPNSLNTSQYLNTKVSSCNASLQEYSSIVVVFVLVV